MLRHLLRLTWKRKTRNIMLSLEILLAFAIVFGIAAFALRSWQLYHLPLGFSSRDVWAAELQPGDNGKTRIDAATYDAFRRAVHELPEVEEAAFMTYAPYSWSSTNGKVEGTGGASASAEMIDAGDDLPAVLGMRPDEGRWFAPVDNGAAAQPVVVDRSLARALFPGQTALGRTFTGASRNPSRPYKVVGVVDAYRNAGELMTPKHVMFVRFAPDSGAAADMPRDARTLVLRVKPGTDRSFETRLNRRLKTVRGDWSYGIAPLAVTREGDLGARLLMLKVVSTIAAFMLVMVAFGLFGVLWQNTTQRIPEMGLRRAVGARAGDIYRQIVAEQLLLSSAAIALGLVLLVQLPLTGALGETLNWPVFAGAAGLSMAVIYLLSLLCSLYPGWRASRLSPADALHYE